jgi:hypothetical protein
MNIALILRSTYFTALCFNDLCQYITALNLRCLILALTPFSFLHSITPAPLYSKFFLWNYHFFIYSHVFQEIKWGVK